MLDSTASTTAEFKQRAVAEHLEQRAAEARQARRDHLAENAVERRQRVRLVSWM